MGKGEDDVIMMEDGTNEGTELQNSENIVYSIMQNG